MGNLSRLDAFIIISENLKYVLEVYYAKIGIGQKFIDYLGPIYFNCLNNNIKKLLRIQNNIIIDKTLCNFYLSNV